VTAKNYLASGEISELNRIVTMFLDFAEDQAQLRKTVTMQAWEEKLDRFLVFTERALLKGAGSLSANAAKQIAHEHYDAFDSARQARETEEAEREHLDELKKIEARISDNPARKNQKP
jgi:hypothetical protein